MAIVSPLNNNVSVPPPQKPPVNNGPGPGNPGGPLPPPHVPPENHYASPSIYQTSPAYVDTGRQNYPPKWPKPQAVVIGGGWHDNNASGGWQNNNAGVIGGGYQDGISSGSIHPQTLINALQSSSPASPPVAPTPQLQTTPTGQFGLSGDSNPYFAGQIQQPSVTTGNAQPQTLSVASKPHVTPPKTPHKAPSAFQKYLGSDADYQSTMRDLQRALTDFKARQIVDKTRAGTEYGYAKRTEDLQKTQDLKNIMDDFAARGIVRSGVYAQRVGDYNTSFDTKRGELSRQYNNQLTDFATQLRDFQRQQSLQQDAAKQAAIRRRAAKLGKIN